MRAALATLTAAAALAAAAAPAAAEDAVAVAYGTGATSCSFSVSESKRLINIGGITYDYAGETDCSVAVQQSGLTTLYDGSSVVVQGPLCSGFQATCRSSGDYFDVGSAEPDGATYQVMLVAPF